MNDDLRVVFESTRLGACSDRALVLESVQIPHEIVRDSVGCAIVVPAERSGDAVRELQLYDEENPPVQPRRAPGAPHFDPMPGIFGYIVVISLFASLSANVAFGTDWLGAGRVDGILIRAGDWWRLFTAQTLHSGVPHLVGNIVFGTVFGLFAGRLLGSGVAWCAIIVSAAAGNLLNTLLLESAHRSIGASTAVFAALGLVAGYVWRAKLMSQERWPYRIGPIVGGLALLMYTGSGGGDGNTDVGAHLLGFLCGFGGGMLMTRATRFLTSARVQLGAGIAALTMILVAWIAALIGQQTVVIM